MRYVCFVLYLVSVVYLPWWVSVPLGILTLMFPFGSVVAILGGVILDATYGTALTPLGGISYLYTTTFVLLALGMSVLKDRIID